MPRLLRVLHRRETEYPAIVLNAPRQQASFPPNTLRSTKYTLFSFPFVFLFNQFKLVTNIYFLFIMIICCIPQISTVTPVTSVVPLVVVLLVAAIKEIYEDIRRFLADRRFNAMVYTVRSPAGLASVPSAKLRPGMFVVLPANSIVPADCIALHSSNEDGLVFVQTTALDGETNLKELAIPGHFIGGSPEALTSLVGTLRCESPHPAFDRFKASFDFDDTKIGITEKNLLLQGTIVRQVEEVIGLVCYCGKHTKLSQNQTQPRVKRSRVDTTFNWFVGVMIVVQTVICAVLALLAGLRFDELQNGDKDYWYLPRDNTGAALYGVKKFFGYFTLISYIIPISCQVSLELSKFVQGLFLEADSDMVARTVDDEGRNVESGMKAKATSLNDQLGLVEYVLSDKTGTLTENQMTFRYCSVGDEVFTTDELRRTLSRFGANTTRNVPVVVDLDDSELVQAEEQENSQDQTNRLMDPHPEPSPDIVVDDGNTSRASFAELRDVVFCMALCNAVTVQNGKYGSPSPDENTLYETALGLNVEIVRRNQRAAVVRVFGVEEKLTVLATFPFDSTRKRMSVMLRGADGVVTLWTKGADNVMAERSTNSDAMYGRLGAFSAEGLRTLVLAKRVIPEDTFADWYERWDDACNSVEGREEAITALQDEAETGLTVVGVTGIEDKLQAGVPETVELLKRAGIKTWVITGDKMETAINIGVACRLLDVRTERVATESEDECRNRLREVVEYLSTNPEGSVVVNGKDVEWCMTTLSAEFRPVVLAARCVVCCRVTPLQKATIAAFVKKTTKKVVLTVGDGANDVPMINTGDIGVGIFGREGNQAVRASDFALQKFRHLAKLVLFHGRQSLLRNALLIKLCFYKNAAFFLIFVWYSFVSDFTCQVLYDDYMMTFFNILLTSVPPVIAAVCERDLTWQTIRQYPEANREMLHARRVGLLSFIGWFVFGVYQSLVFFFFLYFVVLPTDVSRPDGVNGGLVYSSLCVTWYSFLAILVTFVVETRVITAIVVLGQVLSVLLFVVLYAVLCFAPGWSTQNMSWYGYVVVFSTPQFYLLTILVVVFAVLPLFVKKAFERHLNPAFWHILQEQEKRTLHESYGTPRVIHDEDSPELREEIARARPLLPTHQAPVELEERHEGDGDDVAVHVMPQGP